MHLYGYAGEVLKCDLSSGNFSRIPTNALAGPYIGGRGIAARLFWDEVPPSAGAFDPQNALIIATGPMSGLPVIAGSRWTVCGKSPASSPEHFSYANLGGRWGASLKFAGFDALAVTGSSKEPVYILLDGDTVSIRNASSLWGRGAIETRKMLQAELGDSARVLSVGPAGENRAVMATLLGDNDASGSAGLGAVMGSKMVKAIVIRAAPRRTAVAHPDKLRELTEYYRGLWRITLPSSAYRYSPEVVPSFGKEKMKKGDPCYGCRGCMRRLYEASNGQKGKYLCASALFYQPWVVAHHGEWVEDLSFYATKIIDNYGLDSKAMDQIIGWLDGCRQAGLLTDENAGLALSKIGSLEFIETLSRMMAFREGIGELLAGGLHSAAAAMGPQHQEIAAQTGYLGMSKYALIYDPRLYIAHAILFATEPRLPMSHLHEYGTLMGKFASWAKGSPGALASADVVRAIAKRFWGSEAAGDLSTYEGKALAAKIIQDRATAKESLILCDLVWPVLDMQNSPDHVGDPALESRLLSSVTGHDFDEEALYKVGERVFNMQRAIMVREGHQGRLSDQPPLRCFNEPLEFDQINQDCLVPGKDGAVVSRKGAMLDRASFEQMKDEYYRLRGWCVQTGLQTKQTLDRLGLGDVATDLHDRGLLGPGKKDTSQTKEA